VPAAVDGRLFDVPVLACTDWRSNGHLIADVAHVYFPPDARVLDVTYGRGNWWTRFRPVELVAHDLKLDGVDFRHLPEPDASFDVVAFDPPYVPAGSEAVTDKDQGVGDYLERYGIDYAPTTSAELLTLILGGLGECARVVRPGGLVLVKCQPYQSGRAFHHVPARVIAAGERLGLRLLDELVHRRRPGPTSTEVFQRARRNHSNLLVFDRRVYRTATVRRLEQLESPWQQT
jgi:hypothetical protein